jgi:RNA polymerase sigma-70 factor (ECF subfamily)
MRVMTGEAAIAVVGPRTGDDGSRLGVLFDVHHQRLYRLARRMARDADDARDLVQETFLRAARSPSAIPVGAGREEAWLVRVLVNHCRDRWRQAATRRRLGALAREPEALPAADVEAALVARSVIWRALETLPPRRRAVVVMYELDGVTIPRIARMLGVTQTTVRWHLSTGRRQIARAIRAAGEPR